jgi:hypothetical protein
VKKLILAVLSRNNQATSGDRILPHALLTIQHHTLVDYYVY